MSPKKNVGGPKGKGPAKKAASKRPPPPDTASSEDEGVSAEDLSALLIRVNELEKERGLAAAAAPRPARKASKASMFKTLLSRVSILETNREASRPTGVGEACLARSETPVRQPEPLQIQAAVQSSSAAQQQRDTASQLDSAMAVTSVLPPVQRATTSSDGAFQTASTCSRRTTGTHARPSLAGWNEEILRGMSLALAPNSRKSYLRTVQEFIEFRQSYSLPSVLPVPYDHIAKFCVYSKRRGLAPQTIRSKLAALAYWLKAQGLPDFTNDFRLHKVVSGWSREGQRQPDGRQPFTPDILRGLRQIWPRLCSSHYEQRLFHAASLTAFFGALRVSELIPTSKKDLSQRALLFSDVTIRDEQLQIRVRSSKTDQRAMGSLISLSKCADDDICPVFAVTQFITIRGSTPGYFFCHQHGGPLTKYQFWTLTAKALKLLGLGHLKFGTHSFRIGAASTAANLGYDSVSIKTLGRWRSEAYKGYVRPVPR
ncbi:uncharacterized protein [Anolis sagrei]|uniref:uncharacterized protein isoform X1 n=1 Tax=Anolis sagrei TaxID=38937 RepID=UPI00352231D9